MRIRFALLVALLMSLVFTPSAQAAPPLPVAGYVTTLAGTGSSGEGGDGPATQSALAVPFGASVDALGNVYIADTFNHRIQRVDTDGNVTTIAGTGSLGLGGDGVATSSALRYPSAATADAAGNVYVVDSDNNRIQRVDTDGNVTTLATGSLDSPYGIAVGPTGNFFIVDSDNHRIQKVDTDGTVTTVNTGSLNNPRDIEIDAEGNLYIADTNNHRIQKVDTTGAITTVAGTGNPGAGGDGLATSSALNVPWGVAVDSGGNLYVADTSNHRIQKVDSDGNVTTVSSGSLNSNRDIEVDSAGTLYITDSNNHRIQKVAFDATNPTTNSITATTSRSGSGHTIGFSCSDTGGSELATCTATLDGHAVNNGDPLTDGRGSHTLVITATDNAGNTATETTTITVYGKRELAGDYAQADGPTGSIARLYMATFGRNPEGEGFAFWETAHANGMSLQAIADYFVAGKEFGIKYGDTTNSEFVDLMYLNVMNRTSDAEGHAFWLGQLNGGMTQARMLLMFSESEEFKGLTYTS